MRMRLLPLLLALALGGATAFLISCGGSDRSHLIPSADANDLNSALDQVAAATKAGDCTAAGQALSRAQGVLVRLPASVDSRLKQRLQDGIASLRRHVPSQCQKTTSTQATTTQAPPVTTATQTTQTQTTQTATTQTATTQTQTGTTSTPTTTTPPTTTSNTTGGAGR